MKSQSKTGILSLLLLFSIALQGQQYLLVKKAGTLKYYSYETGDRIRLQTLTGELILNGRIMAITREAIKLEGGYEIKTDNIAVVFKKRGFYQRLSTLFFIQGGVAYTTIVGINSLINNERPLVDEQTLWISGAMIGIGFALKPLIYRKLDLRKNWHLKVLDFQDELPD
jgi:cytochrome bd-type quinol oxidase subunit 2